MLDTETDDHLVKLQEAISDRLQLAYGLGDDIGREVDREVGFRSRLHELEVQCNELNHARQNADLSGLEVCRTLINLISESVWQSERAAE